ncbi:hypothetical protein Cs7R123_16860 [Catellatospora sp. TT07R-123]|uniref:hypothetical protein n=1 Tax=Catellatospora sp. TT07R-123 TaxID=2733863 RepID=UPI001B19A135|nr:hypothetical protein [Catellatospora sp. TT07R-123]GHJ44344.1 hypothetical protein Cs7R123_16860 [Catellatospora sp. TT07R-123]
MPEQTDPMTEAFFQFRLEAPHEVVVPGAAAARRTVQRRRTARTGVLAAIAAIALAAGAYTAGVRATRTTEPAGPSAAPSSPPLTDEQLQPLGVRALRILGYLPEQARPGMLFGPVGAGVSGFSYSFGTPQDPLPLGEYTLRAVCVGGAGQVRLRWEAADSHRYVSVPCDETVTQLTVALTAVSAATITFSGDDRAGGHSGIAVTVTNPNLIRAEQAFLSATGPFLSRGSGELNATRRDVDEAVTSGSLRLDVACAGAGVVTVRLILGGSTDTAEVPCTSSPQLVTLRLDDARGGPLTVELDPDQEAFKVSAAAYRVRRA